MITFYHKITSSVDVGRAVDVVYLDFSKTFDTVSHSLFLDKLARYRLDGWSVRWVGNWLTGCTQRLVINEVFQPLDHFRGPPLDPLQQLHVLLVLRAPELDAVLQHVLQMVARQMADLLQESKSYVFLKEGKIYGTKVIAASCVPLLSTRVHECLFDHKAEGKEKVTVSSSERGQASCLWSLLVQCPKH
ncbi:hypothetical protein QYF61_004837 [Mycteria americana]|uniref:Reverse transcriptase domain-containing protein n=1 Tax=Mycteria americana TaxID=33587 RepID=A0AAN7MXK8_MYCAM|nr:hypothetical protein QYF61_004837 [Mycteria americana]